MSELAARALTAAAWAVPIGAWVAIAYFAAREGAGRKRPPGPPARQVEAAQRAALRRRTAAGLRDAGDLADLLHEIAYGDEGLFRDDARLRAIAAELWALRAQGQEEWPGLGAPGPEAGREPGDPPGTRVYFL